MVRFAAAVLAVAAITPTPAEKGFARLSEALASPAIVNNDDLAQWTRSGAVDKMAQHSALHTHSHRGGAVVVGDGAVLSMLHVRGADGVDVGIGLAPSWKGTLYGTPLMATLAVEAAFCNELRKQCSHLVPFLFGETNLHGADGMGVDIGLAPSWKGTLYGTPLMATLVVEAAFCNELRKQCRHLVPFLFGEANPNPNQRPTAQLRPTWLAIVTGRARPDEPEVVGGVQGW